MIFSDLYGAQLDIELGSGDRAQLFTTARRKKAVNDAMHNWERVTGCTPVYGTIALVSTVAEYDLFTAFLNFISFSEKASPSVKMVDPNGNVSWVQGEDDFPRIDPERADTATPGWRADPVGAPSRWYLRHDAGTSYIGLDPAPSIPAGWTYSLLVPYLASSDDMVSDGDAPFSINGIPFARLVPYHQFLVHYAAGLLEPLRKNYSGAKRQMDLYAGGVAQYQTKERRDGFDQVTFVRSYLREAARPSRPMDPRR